MILITTDKIKEIAGELDCGFTCFLHKSNNELLSIYGDEDAFYDPEEDAWADYREKIATNPEDYLEIEKMGSHDSFLVMEDFAESVESKKLRSELIYALNNKKPFSKFKYLIDGSGDYREPWFAFKNQRIQEWVKDQIDAFNRSEDEEDNE